MSKEGWYDIISENVTLLVDGWREKVEYTVDVAGAKEQRVNNVKRPGLLDQLADIKTHKDTDRNPKAERGAPRVKTAGKPPGDLAGMFTLDEITCDIYAFVDRLYEEADRDRSMASAPVREVLKGMLHHQVRVINEDHPHLIQSIIRATNKWVHQARSALRITVGDAQFGDTVCGNCSGGLAIAWDNQGDVRCVGTPSAPPCGETYPMSEWVSLYEKGRRG